MKKTPHKDTGRKSRLRSTEWFGRDGIMGFIYRSWLKNQGHPDERFDGRPVIGICNTWSDFTPCNTHHKILAAQVKQGVLDAGGFPLEFPVMSLGEVLLRPTAMLYRNLLSMEVEESIRGYPMDGVVLLTGCDKTTPGTLMGACSVDLPTIVVSGGPMLSGRYKGRKIGSGTDVWRFSEAQRAGKMTEAEFREAESCMSRSDGHCMSMGTASTMASLVEAMGMALPQGAAIPAVDSRRKTLARDSGVRIVEMVREDLRPSQILTKNAFLNAIVMNAAIGGSTNAVVHLLAIAGRIGVDLTLDDIDTEGRDVPLLVNLMPAGEHLMEDFFYAGGVPAVVSVLGARMHTDNITVTGRSLQENCEGAKSFDPDVIGSFEHPFGKDSGIAVLRGNLAPDGAIIKPAAASKRLMQHTGPALVFEDHDDYLARIDDPDLDVTPDSVLVLKNVGPKGYPGMPEVGNMAMPKRLLKEGVADMVRISDGRMSGTAFGTVVLHVAPESAAGGPLALVETGDIIELDVPGRRLNLQVDDGELERRRQQYASLQPHASRGYVQLYVNHVLQADRGADFDFLVGGSGSDVPRDNH